MNKSKAEAGRGLHFVLCNERLLPRFGVDRLLLVLGQSLVQQGHRVTFVCLRCDRAVVERISPALRVLEGVGHLAIGAAEERAAAALRAGWNGELFPDGPPDVLISGGWPFFGAAAVCAERGARSVFIDAGAVPQDGMPAGALPVQRELRRIRARQLPGFDAILPISAFIHESQTLPDRGSTEGVETILLGADHLETSLFDAPDGRDVDSEALARVQSMVAAGEKPVMLLGRFEPAGYKNSPAGLAVFESIHAEVPEARLLILAREGEIPVPAAIAGAVVPIGFVGDDTLREIMRVCEVGLSLSLWEGFNLPLAEMQWLGRPALAFSLAAHPEVIVDPWLLCAQPADMTHKAIRILRTGLPGHLRTEGRFERFRARFGWRTTLEKYVAALMRIAALPKSSRALRRVDSDAGPAPRIVLIDCTCASVDPANPGVIRVTRRLGQSLQRRRDIILIPVRWDAWLDTYRVLHPSERDTLATYDGPSCLPLPDFGGTLDSVLEALGGPQPSVLVLPEVVLDGGAQKRVMWARARDLRLAGILYDVIPMTHPLFCAREVVERFPEYLETLASLDAVWSISRASLDQFRIYATRSGLPSPAGTAVQLPGQFGALPRQRALPSEPSVKDELTILCVCSIEPRKNHRTLIHAYEALRRARPELRLRLVLVGHRFAEADDLISWLQRVMHKDSSIVWPGLLSDDALATEFRRAAFTVYPSMVEGFGLPIMESLWMARPCLCHSDGVMAELAAGGGCATVDMLDAQAVADAMEELATNQALRHRLALEAAARDIADWESYGVAIAERIAAL